jgi:transcriptional regulator with XRE-family HTH domain
MARLTSSRSDGKIRAVPGAQQATVETVGARLRRLRVEQGFSQRDLSEPGITYAYISRIEAGARTPSVKALRRLAKKLGVTPEYLETGSDLDASEFRELRLAEQELSLRIEGDADTDALTELLEDADAHADVAAATRARIALGFEAATRGDHGRTIALLSDVIDSELVTPVSRPDVYSTLGRALAASGSAREAVALFEGALAAVDGSGSDPENLAARVRYST